MEHTETLKMAQPRPADSGWIVVWVVLESIFWLVVVTGYAFGTG